MLSAEEQITSLPIHPGNLIRKLSITDVILFIPSEFLMQDFDNGAIFSSLSRIVSYNLISPMQISVDILSILLTTTSGIREGYSTCSHLKSHTILTLSFSLEVSG